ncbi:N-acetylmannosamine-6-phosphate 2-epimerase [Micromonospora olivasterospora]|nr:putative N-acetylmannosamine-6-phosphate 2-epimerase [Micromonospora olivasterospora]
MDEGDSSMPFNEPGAHGVVISCQAPESSPLRDSHVMARLALAAQKAGAVGIRAEGGADIAAIRAVCSLPVIGIRKHWYAGSDVYITPTKADVDTVADAGAELVALDATPRPRPGGETLAEVVAHAKRRGLKVMADLSGSEEAKGAVDAGVDYLGTTLVPASAEDVRPGGPNVAVIRRLVEANWGLPVIAEGRFATPGDIVAAFGAGAAVVVVGRAVTDAYALAGDMVRAANEFRESLVGPRRLV